MEATNENMKTTGKKGLSGPASNVIAAIIGVVGGILVALIGKDVFPS